MFSLSNNSGCLKLLFLGSSLDTSTRWYDALVDLPGYCRTWYNGLATNLMLLVLVLVLLLVVKVIRLCTNLVPKQMLNILVDFPPNFGIAAEKSQV